MKKVFIISFSVLVFSVLLFLLGAGDIASARSSCPVGGLVPCGGPNCPCRLCDLFVMASRIVNDILFKIVPALAALMIAIGGLLYVTAFMGIGGEKGKGPEGLSKAKKLIMSVIIGLVIVYGAWLLVNTFFWAIGVQGWTGLQHGWWQINCS